jgi:hypothetical protein
MRRPLWSDKLLAVLLLGAAVSPLTVRGAGTRPVRARLSSITLQVAGQRSAEALSPTAPPPPGEVSRLRLSSALGKPKIAYSFNPEDDLAAIRRAGFTHVLISYLQDFSDEAQQRKLDECQRHGLKLIYRLVDQVDRDRRTGGDERTRHAVLLLRDHPALAAWQTFEETNLPPEPQIAVYRKIKSWDPRHPIIIATTNEYSEGWYRRTYSDDAQDVLMIDFYPYKRRYDGWIYIWRSVPAMLAVQKRRIPIIPIIQASSATHVPTSDDTTWPPPGGLEKQLNLWWSLGADAGVAFWLWRGSRDYPFVGLADPTAPAYALRETAALLARIPDGDLPAPVYRSATETRRHGDTEEGKRESGPAAMRVQVEREKSASPESRTDVVAVRVREPRVNHLANSGFEHGLEGWVGYSNRAELSDQGYAGHNAARMQNAGAPKAIGIGQRVDVPVPPNTTFTASCYYRVLRETSLLQWTIDSTAFPRFGAAEFFERRERLPAGGWKRATVSLTNTTGITQRIRGVSASSNAFTGDVLLDNFQLEMGPQATAYTDRDPELASIAGKGRNGASVPRLRFALGVGPIDSHGSRTGDRWSAASAVSHAIASRSGQSGWTLSGCSAAETLPSPDGYACLVAVERRTGAPLELRLRVDSQRSDANGWIGSLEVAGGDPRGLRMPVALAPGQALFWALTADGSGRLTLYAAPAGYRLDSAAEKSPTVRSSGVNAHPSVTAICLGADARGEHPLNGLAGDARLMPRALTLEAVEQLRSLPGQGRAGEGG